VGGVPKGSRPAHHPESSDASLALVAVSGSLPRALSSTLRASASGSTNVGVLLVAPGEAAADRHGHDHRVVLRSGMRAGMAGLRLAATDVSARGAQAKAVATAAFLAAVTRWCRERLGNMGAGGSRAAERSKPVHAVMFAGASDPGCEGGHTVRVGAVSSAGLGRIVPHGVASVVGGSQPCRRSASAREKVCSATPICVVPEHTRARQTGM